MPRKLRRPKGRRHVLTMIDLDLFRIGDGTWSYFHKDPSHLAATREVGARMWNEPGIRAAVWGMTHRGTVPGGAEAYDGITERGRATVTALVGGGRLVDKPRWIQDALDTLDADRAAVDRFEEDQPAAAAEIAAYLAEWRGVLDDLEALVHAFAADDAPTGGYWTRAAFIRSGIYGDEGTTPTAA